MQIVISAQDESVVQELLASGRYENAGQAVHAALAYLRSADDDWLSYARQQIAAGAADIAAGRIVDGEPILRDLARRAEQTA